VPLTSSPRTPRAGLGRVLVALAVPVAVAGCGLSLPSPGAVAPSVSTRVEHTSTPTAPAAAALTPAQLRVATTSLAALPVKGRAPRAGYDRDAFGPAWTDDVDVSGGHNGCDTRNDVLRRDLSGERLKPGTHGCVVLSGLLADPYTGRTIAFTRGPGTSTRVQIDHVVALGDAWVTGAQQLTTTQRTTLANDPLNLLAVDGPTNSAKRDADAASWLPPNKAFRCPYVARQVAVKARYRLWVTAAEKSQIARLLAACTSAG
jgi:hypothetical protein